MKQLPRYLIALLIGGAFLFYLGVWRRDIHAVEDPNLSDVAIATTQALKSGYNYGLEFSNPMTTTPFQFSAGPTSKPTVSAFTNDKLSLFPEGSVYAGSCGPNQLELTYAPGTRQASMQLQGIEIFIRLWGEGNDLLAIGAAGMIPSDVTAGEYGGLIDFSNGPLNLLPPPHEKKAPPKIDVVWTPLPGFEGVLDPLGVYKLSFSFLLHFAGAPDEELWWELTEGGDEALVAFESGDVHHPILISLYPCSQKPPVTPRPTSREKEEEAQPARPCSGRSCP